MRGWYNFFIKNKFEIYSGYVWLFSALVLFLYLLASIFYENQVPGVSDLFRMLSDLKNEHIYIVASLAIFLEGLYIVGAIFPGSGLVALLAILSQSGGYFSFLLTIFIIFVSWCLSGFVNIFIAKKYKDKIKDSLEVDKDIKDSILLTWFPVFRANYEMSQIVEGGDTNKVILSSIRVRFYACLFMGFVTFLVPFFKDLDEVSDDEGYAVVILIIVISVWVGVKKFRG